MRSPSVKLAGSPTETRVVIMMGRAGQIILMASPYEGKAKQIAVPDVIAASQLLRLIQELVADVEEPDASA